VIICFNGIDGSGKSLQAHALVERLNGAGYPAVYAWLGGESPVTRPLIRLGQRLLRAPTVQLTLERRSDAGTQYRAYIGATRRLFRRRAIRDLWLHISLLEHACEIWLAVLPHLRRDRIVVCDRYLYDTIINVAVLSGADATALSRLLRVPALYRRVRPDKWFLLDVPFQVAFERKDDIPDMLYLARRVPLYRAAGRALGMQVIDGTQAPESIAAVVWRSIQPLLAGEVAEASAPPSEVPAVLSPLPRPPQLDFEDRDTGMRQP